MVRPTARTRRASFRERCGKLGHTPAFVMCNSDCSSDVFSSDLVPCLLLDDNGSLFDSRVFVEYLDTLSPVGRLIPQQGRDRAATKCWEAIADGVLDAAVAINIENTKRPAELRSQQWVDRQLGKISVALRSEEHTSELQSLMRISYAVFCLKKKKQHIKSLNNQ